MKTCLPHNEKNIDKTESLFKVEKYKIRKMLMRLRHLTVRQIFLKNAFQFIVFWILVKKSSELLRTLS